MIKFAALFVLASTAMNVMAQPSADQLDEFGEWQQEKASLPSLTAPPMDGIAGGIDADFAEPESLIGISLVDGKENTYPSREAIDMLEQLRSPEFTGTFEEISDSPENRNQEAATPPTPFLYPYSFPWTTHYKLRMEFSSGAEYVCSASSAGSFHLITAGHCIYNHSEGGWATAVYAYPAATDVISPMSEFDFPFGEAFALTMHTYTGWINNQDLNHDFAILEMNWRVGTRTGWMGKETNTAAASLNYNGYPIEYPYIPFTDRYFQHPDFEATNGYSTYRIGMLAYVYGGHSGGPVWRFADDRYTQGVNSTSNRTGNATATRITNNKFNDINAIMADDEANSPPVPRSELVEYVFASGYKGVAQTEIRPGGTLDVTWNVYNTGVIHSGPISVYFYLSPIPILTGSSTLVHSTVLANGLGANVYTWRTDSIPVPEDMPSRSYYVHWLFLPDETEYNGSDNVGLASSAPILVDPHVCLPDFWESDDLFSPAVLYGISPISRTLCPGSESDWFRIRLTEPLNGISVVTGGSDPDADTEFDLLTETGAFVVSSTDGSDNYAGLEIDCSLPLIPTENIVRLESGNGEMIDDYWIDVEIQPCPHISDIQLFSGITESGSVSGSQPFDDWSFYYLDLDDQAVDVEIRLHDLSGDADLYVRSASKPTARSWECRPYFGGTAPERCQFSSTSAHRIYVGIANWSSGPISFQVTANVSETPFFKHGFED